VISAAAAGNDKRVNTAMNATQRKVVSFFSYDISQA
jgi:hypothetical protein